MTKGNRSGKENYSCCHFRSSYLTVLSRNCLKNGASCGYPAPASDNLDPSANVTVEPGSLLPSITPSYTSTTPTLNLPRSQGTLESTSAPKHHRTEVISWYSNMAQPSFSTMLPAARTDPFHTLPLELSRESKMLLDHCKSSFDNPFASGCNLSLALLANSASDNLVTNNRILLQKTVQSRREYELFRFATSDAALLHGALVLAASNWMKLCGGQRAFIEPTFYQHKTEAIRIINERMGDSSVATSDATVGAIACLVILEVGVHSCTPKTQEMISNRSPGAQWSCSHC